MASGLLLTLGGLGVFLLGMIVMTNGLRSLAGDAARRALTRFTHSPLSGAVTGAGVTALVQSSSVTTVTAVGFVGAGLITFSQSLGIVLGANVGTTITGWMVAILGFKLKIGLIAMPLILPGVLMHLFLRGRASSAGLAAAGFGLVFVGIGTLQEGMAGFEGIITPEDFPEGTIPGRLLLVLFGIGITLITQSSSAGVATALVAVNTGTITFTQAGAMVIGMDVGTTVTAALAAIGGSTDARRTACAHVLYNLLTAIGAFFLLPLYGWAWETIAPDAFQRNPEIALVGFHTLFNLLGVSVILSVSDAFGRLVIRIVPERKFAFTERLDRTLFASPSIAVEAARATLKDLSLAVFIALLKTMRHEKATADMQLAGRRTPSIEEINESLKRTRDYLARVDSSSDDGLQYERHLSALHAIDHLRRLIDRCEEQDRAGRIPEDSDLAGFGAELSVALGVTITQLRQQGGEPPADHLRDIWQRVDARSERYRHELIESAASGDQDTFTVIGRFDTLRWLHRVSYHVWRIVHHLHRAQIDETGTTEEERPPHQEQLLGE